MLRLTHHDLIQMDGEYLDSMDMDGLRSVSHKLLSDLKEMHERANQDARNSSVPPSRQPAYLGTPVEDDFDQKHDDDDGKEQKKAKPKRTNKPTEKVGSSSGQDGESQPKKRSGKQVGAPGYGRTQHIDPHHIIEHRAEQCAACGSPLSDKNPFVACVGFHVLDLQVGDETQPGIQLVATLHKYGDSQCNCGHQTRTYPGRGDTYKPEGRKNSTELSEWRLIGPTLASLIVCLSFRMRLSRSRIREFLQDWLKLRISTGTINNCIAESGLAASPLEEQLIDEVQQSGLLHIDETPWKEWGKVLWLWVFVTGSVVLFLVGRRTRQILTRVLGDIFTGWIMSDGHVNYRHYDKRLRCHAHLRRKAVGLHESLNKEAREFGGITLFVLTLACRQVKGKLEPAKTHLLQAALVAFKQFCELHNDHKHEKTRQLAVEFLNDWEAIWRVLELPDMPLTNNEAERALRHWVIARLISQGTRTPEGSRTLGILASIIETCRRRGVVPWPYLASIIAARRCGKNAPPLPVPVAA